MVTVGRVAGRAVGDWAVGDRAVGDWAVGDRAVGDWAVGDWAVGGVGLRDAGWRPPRSSRPWSWIGWLANSGYGKDLSGYGFDDYTRIKHVMSSLG